MQWFNWRHRSLLGWENTEFPWRWVWVWVCVHVCVFMCMNVHTCMSVSMCVLVCEGVNMYVCERVYVSVCYACVCPCSLDSEPAASCKTWFGVRGLSCHTDGWSIFWNFLLTLFPSLQPQPWRYKGTKGCAMEQRMTRDSWCSDLDNISIVTRVNGERSLGLTLHFENCLSLSSLFPLFPTSWMLLHPSHISTPLDSWEGRCDIFYRK